MALQLTPWDNTTSFVDSQGRLTQRAQLWLQNALQQLYDEFGALAAAEAAQSAAAAANAAAATAQTAANNADAAASTAQGSAEAAAAAQALASSGTTDLTLTAADVGASVTITISGHNRVYGDGTAVSVSGAILTGRAYNTTYYIYYNDPARAGGSVTYQTSTDENDAIQAGSIHSVGEVLTPIAADPPQNGYPYPAPGIIVKRQGP